MIEAVVGLIGGGKSCLAIYRALKYVSEGGRVYMNMHLVGACEACDIETQKEFMYLPPDAPFCRLLRKRYKWEYQQGQYNLLVPEDMDRGFQTVIPAGTRDKKVLVIIDEVNEWFDTLDRSRASKTDDPYRKTLRFLRQSRKVYIDCIFILQVFTTLDSRIRELTAFVWMCRDMQYFEVAGVRLGWVLKRFFVWQKFYKDCKVAIAKPKWVAKDLDVFSCYDTEELFGDGLGVVPAGTVKTDFSGQGVIKKTRGKKMNPVQTFLLAACCVFSACCTYLMFRGGGGAVGGARVVTVTNYVGSASSVAANGSVGAVRNVEWAPVSYGCAGAEEWAFVGGCLYKKGFRTDKGMVVEVTKDFIHLMGEQGDYWIFHRDMALSSGQVVRPVVAEVSKKKEVRND